MPTGRAHGLRTLPHSDVRWIELRLHKLVDITFLVRAIYDGCGIYGQDFGSTSYPGNPTSKFGRWLESRLSFFRLFLVHSTSQLIRQTLDTRAILRYKLGPLISVSRDFCVTIYTLVSSFLVASARRHGEVLFLGILRRHREQKWSRSTLYGSCNETFPATRPAWPIRNFPEDRIREPHAARVLRGIAQATSSTHRRRVH